MRSDIIATIEEGEFINFMTNSLHNKLILLVITLLTLSVIILAFLNNTSRPRIIGFEVQGSTESAKFMNQFIKVDFNRPMKNVALTKADIQITPDANFTTAWSGSSLFIYFYEKLEPKTRYSITFSDLIEDVYDADLDDKNIYTFTTKNYEFTYIEDTADVDNIILADIDNTKTTLFSNPTISMYDFGHDLLVAVTTQNEVDSTVYIFNTQKPKDPKLIRKIDLNDTRITRLDVSPTLPEFSYLAQTVELSKEGFLIPKSGNTIYRYEINSDKTTVINPDNTAEDSLVLEYSGDGRYLVYRGTNSQFYIVDLKTPDKSIILGQFNSFAGINFDASYLLFSDFDVLNSFSQFPFITRLKVLDRTTENLTMPDEYVIDPQFFHTKNAILYSRNYQEVIGTQGLFEIVLRDENNQIIKTLREDGVSLELPHTSLDDAYIAAERYDEKALRDFENTRPLILQRKPKAASIVIFNAESGEKVFEVENGYEVRWVE